MPNQLLLFCTQAQSVQPKNKESPLLPAEILRAVQHFFKTNQRSLLVDQAQMKLLVTRNGQCGQIIKC